MKLELRSTDDFSDMLTALLETRRQIVERKDPFTDAPDDIRETLLAVSTAEINLLTWTMGLGDRQNDFMTLGVCEMCGNLGEYATEVNGEYETYPCSWQQQAAAGAN